MGAWGPGGGEEDEEGEEDDDDLGSKGSGASFLRGAPADTGAGGSGGSNHDAGPAGLGGAELRSCPTHDAWGLAGGTVGGPPARVDNAVEGEGGFAVWGGTPVDTGAMWGPCPR